MYVQSFREEFTKVYSAMEQEKVDSHIQTEIHSDTINKDYYRTIGIRYIEYLTE